MKLINFLIAVLLLCISHQGIAQTTDPAGMRSELIIINGIYQRQYEKNKGITDIFKKITTYQEDIKLGKKEYANQDELQALKDFEKLQLDRDQETINVYKKYQSEKFVELMDGYNLDRKKLRRQFAEKVITWRQFADGLELLIIRNQAAQKDFIPRKQSEAKEEA